MRTLAKWLFSSPEPNTSSGRIIGWWELRRIPYNVIVGCYAFGCLIIFFVAIGATGHLRPGEDAVEPITLLFAPCGINIFYTLGWLVEVPSRLLFPNLSPRLGPFMLAAGLALSLVLVTVPAAYWLGYRMLQLAGRVQ